MSPRTKLAFLGGLVGVIGTPLIGFIHNLLWNLLAFLMDTPSVPFHWDVWFSGPWSSILRRDLAGFLSGFVAVLLVMPFAIQRIDSAAQSDCRFPKTGLLYGALAGLICCLFLASIRLRTDFVGPILYRDGFSALPNVLGYYTTYLPIVTITTGPFAAMLGGCAGAIVERHRRRGLRETSTTVAKAD